MKVKDCSIFHLITAGRAAFGFWDAKVKHLGVTAPQAMTLNLLGEEDEILSTVLGEQLQLSSATKHNRINIYNKEA